SLAFFGANVNENIALSANGTRTRLTRAVDGVTMDLNSLGAVNVLTQGGADTITVNDLTGTGVGQVGLFLGDTGKGGDGQADNVIVNGTNGNDNVFITGSTIGGGSLNLVGLSAQVGIFNTDPIDHLSVNTLGGFDHLGPAGVGAGTTGLTVDPGDGQAAGVATTTTLRTSTTTAVFGQPVTLTATVTSAAGVPTGLVVFRAGGVVQGTAQVDANGQAKVSFPLGIGSTSLTASFVANGNFVNSTSDAVPLTVNPAPPPVTLSSPPTPGAAGRSVPSTAPVSVPAPGAGVPAGTVTFMDGNVVLTTVPVRLVQTSTALLATSSFTTSFAAAGNHAIT